MKLGLRETYNVLIEIDNKGSVKSLDHEAIIEDMERVEGDIENSNQKIAECAKEIQGNLLTNDKQHISERLLELRIEAMNISTEYDNLVEEIDKLLKESDALKY